MVTDFFALPTSVLAARDERHKLGDNGAHLWGMGPAELAEAISFNLQTFGKPRFVDFTVLEEPLYSFQPPASFEKVFNAEQRLSIGSNKRLPYQTGALRTVNDKVGNSLAFDLAEEKFADKESFIRALGHEPVIQAISWISSQLMTLTRRVYLVFQ